MAGYWGQPEAHRRGAAPTAGSAPATSASPDDDGYVYIVDRIKDMIISGGENMYPAEVEDALLEHPAVAECAVIGVPDDAWGEVGLAVVVAAGRRRRGRPTPQELLDHLDGRLAKYKIPKSRGLRRRPCRAPASARSSRPAPRDARRRLATATTPHEPLHSAHSTERKHPMPTTANGLDELRALAGTDLGPSDWLEITQDRVNTFADATGDHQWIHVDLERAATGPFGGTIAHGYLTLSLIIPLFSRAARDRAAPR